MALRGRGRGANRQTIRDEELVSLVASGDRSAFVLLIRRFDQLLYRTARSILKDDSEAEDALLAEALAIPKPTVRSRFSRARRLLRESLSKELNIALGDVFPFACARCDRVVESLMAALEPGPAGPPRRRR